MIRVFTLRWLVNFLGLWAAAQLMTGSISYDDRLGVLVVAALIFSLVNAIIRPLVVLLSLPAIVLTLGLFTLVINAVMLMVTGWLADRWDLGFVVSGFWPAFWGGLVVGLVSVLLSILFPAKEH